jgi:hypothetical protein
MQRTGAFASFYVQKNKQKLIKQKGNLWPTEIVWNNIFQFTITSTYLPYLNKPKQLPKLNHLS